MTVHPAPPPHTANFDPIARPYRWLERLTLGRALERCRSHLLARTLLARRALLVGDGDGRFTAALLACNTCLHATAVDSSRAMLTLLAGRCAIHRDRLTIHHTDALTYLRRTPASPPCDLIVTHFFLDCLHQPELDQVASLVAARSTPNALWLVSEFAIPTGWRSVPARLVVSTLYRIFGLLTGLAVRHLPDHAFALTRAGFHCLERHPLLFGLLTSELWQRRPTL